MRLIAFIVLVVLVPGLRSEKVDAPARVEIAVNTDNSVSRSAERELPFATLHSDPGVLLFDAPPHSVSWMR